MAKQQPTLDSVKAARAAVAVAARNRPARKCALTMVYLLEVRVPIENAGDFESEHLEDSLTQYGSCDVIEKGVVDGDI